MRAGCMGVGLWLLATAVQAQVNSPAPLTGTAAITGRVSDALTGEPISGVAVHLRALRSRPGAQAGTSSAESQSDGTFHFDSLGAGTYMLRGERAGYLSTSRFTQGQTLQLGGGQFLNDISLKLMPESKIGGRVYDDAGHPAPGVHVRALEKSVFGGRVQVLERSSGDTDGNGLFWLGKLHSGKYLLIADPPAAAHATEDPNGDLVTTLFPRGLRVEEAEEVEVAAGYSPSDVKIYLQRVAAHHIRGRVPETLLLLGHSKLILAPRAMDSSIALTREMEVAKNGIFDIGGIVPGSYVLRLVGGGRSALLARAEVEVGAGDVSSVVLTSLPPVVISGVVSMDGGDLPPQLNLRVIARPLSDQYSGVIAADAKPDGSFQLSNLQPEQFIFRALPRMSGVYVEAILLNGQDVLAKLVDLGDLGAARMEVVLHGGSASIAGTVVVPSDDNPSGISVVLVPKQVDPIGSNVQFLSTNSNGMFQTGNIRPDDYLLYALHAADGDVWLNTAFLQQMAALGTAVTVTDNQHRQVQLKLTPYEAISEAATQAGVPDN